MQTRRILKSINYLKKDDDEDEDERTLLPLAFIINNLIPSSRS